MADLGTQTLVVQAHEASERLMTFTWVVDAAGTAWQIMDSDITTDMFESAYIRSMKAHTAGATTAHALNGRESGILTVQRGNQQLITRHPMDEPISLFDENAADPPKHWVGKWTWPCPYMIHPGDSFKWALPPADDGGPTGDYLMEVIFQVVKY